MSTRAPATRAGASPAGDAPATIVTEPRFARPFRGASAAASLGMDAGCQTEPLPQLEPLRRLRDARVASLNVSEDAQSVEKETHESVGKDAQADGAADEVFVRREARRSSSVERENAALEMERVTDIADFERRVAARREALTENGVLRSLEGATREGAEGGSPFGAGRSFGRARSYAARTENAADPGTRGTGNAGVVLTPEPPTSGLPAGAEGGASPLVVRRRPRALETGAGAGKHARGEKRFAHEKRNSLSGDGDFIAFDTTLPVPPASPSERDGRARGPTPAGREGLSGFRDAGADGATSAPASPDSPDSDELERDGNASVSRSGFRETSRADSPIALTARRGVAIAQAHAKDRGRRSPGRRVVSPGANGTLHFGSAAPRVRDCSGRDATASTSSRYDGIDVAFGVSSSSPARRGSDAGGAEKVFSASAARATTLAESEGWRNPKKPKPRPCVARRGVPVAAEFARGPAMRDAREDERSILSSLSSPTSDDDGHRRPAVTRTPKVSRSALDRPSATLDDSTSGSDFAEAEASGGSRHSAFSSGTGEGTPSFRASSESVSSLSRSLGSLSGLASAAGEGDPSRRARAAPLARTDTSAFAVVTKKKSVAPSPEGIEPPRAHARGSPEDTRAERSRGGSRAQKSVLTMSLRGERSP